MALPMARAFYTGLATLSAVVIPTTAVTRDRACLSASRRQNDGW
jgi:hypothetical protein